MDIEFLVTVNKDKSEIYSGNITNGFKEGYGKIEYWTSRIEIGEFKNNSKNGYFIEYFNGEKTFEGYYLNGEKDGLGKEYSKNKKLSSEGYYKKGKKHGKFKEYDIDTGLLRSKLYYKDGKKYNGIEREPDYDMVLVDYLELTDKEKDNLVESTLDELSDLDEKEFEEITNVVGTTSLEKEHAQWIIEKFIESNYDEDSIYGKVCGYVFEDKKTWVDRFVRDLKVTEYSRGIYLMNSRFDEFESYFEEEFYKDIICDVKNIYFRKLEVMEFVERFIELYAKEIFSSVSSFLNNWLNVLTYISETSNCNIYEYFIEQYCFNSNNAKDDEVLIRYCKKIFGNSKQIMDKRLIMYLEIIESKYEFKSKKEAILVGWLLLYYKVIQYFSNVFFNEFKASFEDILELDLEKAINIYVKVNKNTENEFGKLMFTAFLLDNRKILKKKTLIDTIVEKRFGRNIEHFKFDIIDEYEEINQLIEATKDKNDIEKFENYIMNYEKGK